MIVALPADGDPVLQISSEKAPHLTLFYLGEDGLGGLDELHRLTEHVEYASTMLHPFTLEVESRGELGDKNADVLFFSPNWSKEIVRFRNVLFQNDLVSTAYYSTDQHPGWTPHLTLGYPESPAKKPKDGWEGYPSFVRFDKIALWTHDSMGPTFTLKPKVYDDMEVAMSQIKQAASTMDDSLKHHGVKGMKWGVRKSENSSAGGSGGSSSSAPRPELSADVKAVGNIQSKILSGGTATLSNQELRSYLERVDLERRYASLQPPQPQKKSELDRGLETTQKILKVGKTIEDVRKFLDTPTGQHLKRGLTTAGTAAAGYATGGTSAAVVAGLGALARRNSA